MIIGVTGDTHNNLKNINQICSIFNECGTKVVLHTGDISLPKSLLAFKQLNCPLIVVLGNNDIQERDGLEKVAKEFDCKIYDEPHFMKLENNEIGLIHHPDLIDSEMLSRCDLILHGHTHRFKKEKIGKTLIFNPGECAGFMKGKNQVGIIDLKLFDIKIFNF